MGNTLSSNRYSRRLSEIGRELNIGRAMLDWLTAIMKGHGQAKIVEDPNSEDGWGVVWPAHGMESTDQQKQWAWSRLREAIYGLPSQEIQISADIQARVNELNTTVNYHTLTPGTTHAIREALRASLAPSPTPDDPRLALAPTGTDGGQLERDSGDLPVINADSSEIKED